MRAVFLTSAFILACGGRSIGDPIFDEQGGTGGAGVGGTRSTGGSGPSGGFGAQNGVGGFVAAGGRGAGGSFARGGFPSFGGSNGFGGSVPSGGGLATGGKASTGGRGLGGKAGFGGNLATGGVGGQPSVPTQKACGNLCSTLFKVCPVQLGGSREECAANCVADLTGSSSECEVAKRDAVNCVSKAIAGNGGNCEALPLLLIPCAPALARAQSCETMSPPPDPNCMSLVQPGPGSCGLLEQCGNTRYVTTCTSAGASMTASCTCEVNGVTVSKSLHRAADLDLCTLAITSPCGPS